MQSLAFSPTLADMGETAVAVNRPFKPGERVRNTVLLFERRGTVLQETRVGRTRHVVVEWDDGQVRHELADELERVYLE